MCLCTSARSACLEDRAKLLQVEECEKVQAVSMPNEALICFIKKIISLSQCLTSFCSEHIESNLLENSAILFFYHYGSNEVNLCEA